MGVCTSGELAVVVMVVVTAMVSLTGRVEADMGTESGSDHSSPVKPVVHRIWGHCTTFPELSSRIASWTTFLLSSGEVSVF